MAQLQEQLEAANARFNEVFDHPTARGRFKEGMSIAQSIYRPVADQAVSDVGGMRVWSVTVEWEDEHEGQWVQTFAILAESEDDAKVFIRSHVRDLHVLGPATDVEVLSSGLWKGAQKPRIVSTLTSSASGEIVRWKDVR